MNGINMNIIEELAKEYSQEPQKGIQPYKANINWNNGLSAVAKVGNHDELLIDEPILLILSCIFAVATFALIVPFLSLSSSISFISLLYISFILTELL